MTKRLKKPYLKRFGNSNQFTVWLVDGNYVRTNIDVEFTDFGQHYRFKCIPPHEFWIDKEATPGEERFYIDHMLVENKLMARRVKYADACDAGDAIEKRERDKINGLHKKTTKKELIHDVHKKLLLKGKTSVVVWLVHGDIVRNKLRTEFTEGGHDKVYNFVPKNEIWIDDDVSKNELNFVILHELNERMLMAHGLDYETAHDNSTGIEYFYRHNPKGIKEKIHELLDDDKYTTDL